MNTFARRAANATTVSAWALFFVGTFLGAVAFWQLQSPVLAKTIFLELLALAVLSELAPVRLHVKGLQLTFALVFVSAASVALSFRAGLIIELIAFMAGAVMTSARTRTFKSELLAGSFGLSCLSCFIGYSFLTAFQTMVPAPGLAAFGAAAFGLGYSIANLTGVALLRGGPTLSSLSEQFQSILRIGPFPIAMYGVLSILASALALDKMSILLFATAIPVFALRVGIDFRERMLESYYDMISALTLMLQRVHPYSHGHVDRVAKVAELVARQLGLGRRRSQMVRTAAVLHDIGKVAIDEAILDKPGALTVDERRHIQQHPLFGAQIMEQVAGLHELANWVRWHHERPDGRGYPDGLFDVEIPIESKIIAVVDAFDAMTGIGETSRKYREPMSESEAIEELLACSGGQFDPKVVEAFRRVWVKSGEAT